MSPVGCQIALVGRLIQLVDHCQDILIGGNVSGVVAVVRIVDHPVFADGYHARHASELQEFEFLTQDVQMLFVWIRDAREGKLFFFPEAGHFIRFVCANRDDFGVTLDKLVIILTQLRQMPAADWSPEAPKHHEDNVVVTDVVAKIVGLPSGVEHVERWCLGARGRGRHVDPLIYKRLGWQLVRYDQP